MKITYFFRHPDVGFSIQRVFETIISDIEKKEYINRCYLPKPNASFLSIIKNGLYARKHAGTINHITGDVHYLLYFLPKSRTIVTVHDIMYYSYLKGIKKLIWKYLYVNSLKRAQKICFISNLSKSYVDNVVNLPSSKIVVIPNPVTPGFSFCPKEFNHQLPVILHIGTQDRKNLLNTIYALKKIQCHLRIVGKLKESTVRVLEENIQNYSNVFDLTDAEIMEEYKNCDIVNFPSLFEGFGMPIIEGQAIGRVVVTSNIEPMKEVAGDGAILVDPHDVLSIRSAYLKIIGDNEFREQLIKNGLGNINRYRLETIGNAYLDIYKNIE